ncbi:MAG: type IV pili twitching motility protein PilT [Zetaproteobacteria bacterium]|nr:type IV pili twitching motility protein PilT [Pseudobdellovibrionaceae bacterium]
MAKIDAFFNLMIELGASDLHLASGQPPMVRINGEIERINYPAFDSDILKQLVYEIATEEKIKVFEETGDVDFAYEIPKLSRFRVNFFNQIRGIAAVFRVIPSKILTLDDLNLPPVLAKLCFLENGLVLVTGPTGSGKSTTLAAMIDKVNKSKKRHILTIEDPVEFVHKPMLCSINHREVGVHTKSFTSALKGALREDPDIILVGEMRDLETISLALEAASTGHLVFGTLHTQSAPKTIDRIIDVFPADEQEKTRISLAESLKGIVAQSLLRKKEGGRIAALEILFCNTAVANLIRERKTHQIATIMQTQKKLGMTLLDDVLEELLQADIITAESAYEKANNKEKFVKYLKNPPDALLS